jgi:uncharacterized membrane protein YfcA
MGFSPMQIVPAILLSELITGILSGVCHHREGNVNFRPRSGAVLAVHTLRHPLQYYHAVRRSFPMDLKVAILLALCSIVGTVASVFIAVSLPKFWIKVYISLLVLVMGLVMLFCLNRTFRFSLRRLVGLGLLASFNKGISGGGYGPIVTGGQILSGVDSKSAVGITSLAEGLTCLVGVAMYYIILGKEADWVLAPWIILGAIFSVPLSAKSVKFVSDRKLTLAIAVLTLVLGAFTLIRTLMAN